MKRPALALLALSTAAYCADSGFDHLVKAVETHYGTRRMHIPLMGLANFVVKVARPAGTSGFKMAIFENLNAEGGDWAELDRFVLGAHGTWRDPR